MRNIVNKIKKALVLILSIVSVLSCYTEQAIAAPKTMKNGMLFDAEFYTATYPDVASAVGNRESALFNHYLTFGIQERRLPYEGADPGAIAASVQAQAPAAPTAPATPSVAAPRSFLKRYRGKNVSIVGDSISTFGGSMPEGYVQHYPTEYMSSRDKTWWMQTLLAGGMNFVANASWTGSRVTGYTMSDTGNPGCSQKRARDLFGKDKAPNLIMIMMGTNDFLGSVPLGSYTVGKPAVSGAIHDFADAYNTMLITIRNIHPGAQIICLTCPPCFCISSGTKYQNDLGYTIDDYNNVIRTVAQGNGIRVCDINACGINLDNYTAYLGDGIHPNEQGMALIASYILNHL